MILLVLVAQLAVDTLKIRQVSRPPAPGVAVDTSSLGAPQVRITSRQGIASVWLLRAADTVFIAASIPDSTPSWGDDFVLSLDTRGDGAPAPEHDDFQLYFRRALDSSVVFRGRNGRWEPPRNDPDWRLGKERSGGGWQIDGRDRRTGWSLLLRMDPAWFAGEAGRPARIAFRIYDNAPSSWHSWPPPSGAEPASSVERMPQAWVPVK